MGIHLQNQMLLKSTVLVVLFVCLSICADDKGLAGPCSAIPVPTSSEPVSFFGNNEDAIAGRWHLLCGGGTAGAVWFKVSAPSGVNVNVTTCNSYTEFDTFIQVLAPAGTCNDPLCAFYQYKTCSDFAPRLSNAFWSANGDDMFVGIGGNNTGNFQVDFIFS